MERQYRVKNELRLFHLSKNRELWSTIEFSLSSNNYIGENKNRLPTNHLVMAAN